MSEDDMKRMAEAAERTMAVPRYCPCGTHWEPLFEDYEKVAAAVLAAAPTVEGWVWCERIQGVVRPRGPRSVASCESPFSRERCPGPHRTLLLGPPPTDEEGDR